MLTVNGTSVVEWETKDGRLLSYFDGEGGAPVCQCGLTVPSSCAGGEACNCDVEDVTQRSVIFNPLTDIPTFKTLRRSALETLWKKETMLVTSIFSFFHNVFYTVKELNSIS